MTMGPDALELCLYRVERGDGAPVGAAFAIGPAGLLVTCTHVLKSAGWPNSGWRVVRFATDEPMDFDVLGDHVGPADGSDVAFLRITSERALSLPHLELSPNTPPTRADLYAYGFPEGADLGGTSGHCRVTGPARIAGHKLLAVASDEVSVGFSGAPAINEESGLVAGMVTSILTGDSFGKGRTTAFLVPSPSLARLHPLASVGRDKRIRQYIKMVSARARSPTYIIEQVTTVKGAAFVAPAVHEEFRAGTPRFETKDTSIGSLVAGYDKQGAQPAYLAGAAGSGKSAILRMIALGLLERGSALPVPLSASALYAARGFDLSDRIREALRTSHASAAQLELSRSFLWDWTRNLGERFVVLVDGLDEIVDRQDRNEFLLSLREVEEELRSNGHALIIASREIDELKSLADYRRLIVDPFPGQSVDELIAGFLGSNAVGFKRHIGRFANQELLSSPLVLQLLLGVYISGDRQALTSMAAIYDAYLSVLERAWRRRGLSRAPVANHALDLLGIAAWCEIVGDSSISIEAAAGDFLASQHGLGPIGALDAAKSIFAFLGNEGGIVRGSANSLEWVHLTFRDYLAARALDRLGSALPGLNGLDISMVKEQVVTDYWDDAAAETFARFVLTSPGPNLERLFANFIAGGDASLCFVGRAIADGSPVPPRIVATFAENLTGRAASCTLECSNLFTPSTSDPIDSLHRLLWFDPVFEAALARLRSSPPTDPKDLLKHERFCVELLEAMRRCCSPEQLERIETTTIPKSGRRRSGRCRAAYVP